MDGDRAGQLNVFAAYTPFHAYVASLIRTAFYRDPSRHTNVLVLFIPIPIEDEHEWGSVLRYEGRPSVGSGLRARLSLQLWKAQAARAMEQRVVTMTGAGQVVRVHFAHLDEFFTNRLFFRYRRNPQFEFYVMPDGMLNYYERRISAVDVTRQLGKCLTGAVAGLPFRPFGGLLTGVDREHVRGQYTLDATHLVGKEKAIVVPIIRGRTAAPLTARTCVILGQEDYIPLIGLRRYESVVQRMVAFVRDNGPFDAIYYKPHHFGARVSHTIVDALPAVRTLASKQPVERLLQLNGINVVVSVTSSALVNAKALLGDGIRCVSVGLDTLTRSLGRRDRTVLQEVMGVFAAFGVERVD